jgi:hypothetical protein
LAPIPIKKRAVAADAGTLAFFGLADIFNHGSVRRPSGNANDIRRKALSFDWPRHVRFSQSAEARFASIDNGNAKPDYMVTADVIARIRLDKTIVMRIT